MSVFGNIISAVFGHETAASAAPRSSAATTAVGVRVIEKPMTRAEVKAMLEKISDERDEKYNWEESIVDLMKLLKLDSSLSSRKQLAQELGYTGKRDGSAEMNVWLHKQVMAKLAESGGNADFYGQMVTKAPSKADAVAEELKTYSHFIPSPEMLALVRQGMRSYSESNGLVDPTFLQSRIKLLSDQDIREFVAIGMWRIMLSVADLAMLEGTATVEVGNEKGFSDRVAHLIVERFPIPLKEIPYFLQRLYDEYKIYVSPTLLLPDRGKLKSERNRLLMELRPAERDKPKRSKKSTMIVTFE